MGIVSYGIVEAFFPREVLYRDTDSEFATRAHWSRLADDICFNKDHNLRSRVREAGHVGWPKDSGVERWEQDERFIDQGLMHASLEEFERAQTIPDPYGEPGDEVYRPTGVVQATIAFMKAYEAATGRKTRILMYEK